MMTPMQKVGFVFALIVITAGLALAVVWSESSPAITQNFDGQQFVKTRDAGWQPVVAGDYAENLFGGLTPEYGMALAAPAGLFETLLKLIPAMLPNTSGNCETEASCLSGGF